MLMVFVFGVKSFQQGSQDVPRYLLVLVYQRLDCMLHLKSKKKHSAILRANDRCFVEQLT